MSGSVTFDDGRTWVLPGYAASTGIAPSRCKSCQASILWVTTTKGRHAPLDQDGTNHFATCPDAPRWRGTDRTVGG